MDGHYWSVRLLKEKSIGESTGQFGSPITLEKCSSPVKILNRVPQGVDGILAFSQHPVVGGEKCPFLFKPGNFSVRII